jgi:hypothetical protein
MTSRSGKLATGIEAFITRATEAPRDTDHAILLSAARSPDRRQAVGTRGQPRLPAVANQVVSYGNDLG